MVLFNYLRDNGRKKITDIDDIRAEIDTQKLKEQENRQTLGGVIKNQLADKAKLEDQIAVQKVVLNELIKQSQLKTSANEKQKNSKKKPDEEEELDIDNLLEVLKQNIIRVYSHGANSNKDF